MALSKELCKNCLSNRMVSNTKWTSLNEKHWKNGWVKCPFTYDASDEEVFKIDQSFCSYKGSGIDVMSSPPHNCPFHLEHILKGQKDGE